MSQHYDDEFGHGQGVTTTEMAVAKYRRRLLQSCGIGILLGAIGFGILERTYMQILEGFWALCLHNAWLLPAIMVIVGFILLVNHPWKRKKGGAKQQRENQPQVSANSQAS